MESANYWKSSARPFYGGGLRHSGGLFACSKPLWRLGDFTFESARPERDLGRRAGLAAGSRAERGCSVRRHRDRLMTDDRRSHARAEIVGQLWGSLGVAHPVKDIGRGGALLEAGPWPPPLSVQRMRLTVGDETEGSAEVRMCRVEPVTGPDGGERHLVGLEFLDVPPPLLQKIDELVAAHPPPAAAPVPGEDRRQARRVPVQDKVRCEMTRWSTVRLVDISLGGALLVSNRPVSNAERAELRVAFDGDPFSCGLEIRRAEADGREGDSGLVRLGVRFRDPDQESRRALGQFLRRAIV